MEIRKVLKINTAKRGKAAGVYFATNSQIRIGQIPFYKPNFIKFITAMKEQSFKWLSVEKWSLEFISFNGNQIGECLLSIEWLDEWVWQSKLGNKAADKS